MQQHLTRIEQANLIAGHAVAYATAYLDGRHTAAQLGDNADRLFLDLLVISTPETSTFLVPVQLLAVAMMRASRSARDEALNCPPGSASEPSRAAYAAVERLDRWHQVIASLVDLVQTESRHLAKDRP